MTSPYRKKVVIFSGAGISAESGISTFRDADGLWENHRIEEVATPEAFRQNPELVHHFYNLRRRQLKMVEPNAAHRKIAALEDYYDVQVITQNVDDLHERAGSTSVIHLHGELKKVRSVTDVEDIIPWEDDLTVETKNEKGHALRPHIVWFGEEVPEYDRALEITREADILIVIGTSLLVYPAAGLAMVAPQDAECYIIDPNADRMHLPPHFSVLAVTATEGMEILYPKLTQKFNK